MAITTSGQIKMSDINTELGRDESKEIKLSLANVGFYADLNPNSDSSPDSTAPHSLTEWYGYNHSE